MEQLELVEARKEVEALRKRNALLEETVAIQPDPAYSAREVNNAHAVAAGAQDAKRIAQTARDEARARAEAAEKRADEAEATVKQAESHAREAERERDEARAEVKAAEERGAKAYNEGHRNAMLEIKGEQLIEEMEAIERANERQYLEGLV